MLENINILFNCYNSYLLLHITHWAHCSCLSSPKNIKKNQFYSIPYIVFNDCLIVFLTWLIHFFLKWPHWSITRNEVKKLVYIQAQVLSRQPLRWRVGRWPGGGPSPPWPAGVLPGAWYRCMCLVCYLSAWVWLRWSCHHPSIWKLIEWQFRIASLSFLSILLTRLVVIYKKKKKKNLEWIETFFLIWNVNQSICNCKICNFLHRNFSVIIYIWNFIKKFKV